MEELRRTKWTANWPENNIDSQYFIYVVVLKVTSYVILVTETS